MNPVIMAVIETIAKGFSLAIEEVVNLVEKKHPELKADPPQSITDTEKAREDALKRVSE